MQNAQHAGTNDEPKMMLDWNNYGHICRKPLIFLLHQERASEKAVYDGQLKALEKAKGHVDRSSQDRVVVKSAPSTASQYPAVKQYDLQSTQVGKQDGWSSLLGIGSDVVVPHLDPPTCGTIRWIGTSPQVLGYVAGVELVSISFCIK